jgi:cobalt/nickel transport system permease protein
MHIPDGFLDLKTAAATAGLASVGLGLALRQARQTVPPARRPLMGLGAAFVFAAQMVNFPVPGGTSGHLIGSTLTAVLLGPSAAVVVMAAVLIVQCFLFSDGGVLALGANIFNMALVASVGGYGVYRAVRFWASRHRGLILASAFGAWCSTVLASISCAGQLALAGTVAWSAVFPAMVNVHLMIGVGEGLITGLIVIAIARARPELMEEGARWTFSQGYGQVIGLGLVLALGLTLFVAPFASPWPDGLERVAAALGFSDKASQPLVSAPLPDYQWPGIKSAVGATAWAGAIGTVAAFGLAWLLARLLVPKGKETGTNGRRQLRLGPVWEIESQKSKIENP